MTSFKVGDRVTFDMDADLGPIQKDFRYHVISGWEGDDLPIGTVAIVCPYSRIGVDWGFNFSGAHKLAQYSPGERSYEPVLNTPTGYLHINHALKVVINLEDYTEDQDLEDDLL